MVTQSGNTVKDASWADGQMIQSEVVLAVFLTISLLSSLVARKAKIPYTILLVFIGLALASIPVYLFSTITGVFNSLVSGNLFIALILPPLLFEGIMSVRVEDFRAAFRPALLMATVGVVIATLVGGVVLWKVVGLPPVISFLFAALISPTDVATVIEIFTRVRVPERLSTLMELESVFNDAAGIAVFTVVLAYSADLTLQPLGAVLGFAYSLGGGALVGLAVAWGARQAQKQVEDSVTQVVLTLLAVYGAYAVASEIGASGLIAVALTGVFYGNTVLVRVGSEEISQATREFWKVLAFVANTVAFLFIGISTNISLLATSLGAVLVAYGVVMMARITSVYPILSLTRIGGDSIPPSWMNVATMGGMRGALAIALVSAVPADVRSSVATLAFGVVIISILLQGPVLTRYTRRVFGEQKTLGSFDQKS